MRTAILFFCAALLSACGHQSSRSSIAAPSVAAIGQRAELARSSVSQARAAVDRAITAGSAAKIEDLKEAKGSLATAESELFSLKTTDVPALQGKVDQVTQSLNKANDRLAYIEPKYASSVGIIWKWRLLAIASWVFFAGFFVARQYFPFLKIL